MRYNVSFFPYLTEHCCLCCLNTLHCQLIYSFEKQSFLYFVDLIFGVFTVKYVTADTGNDEILNQIYVPVIPHSTCSTRDYYGRWVKENTMICAGYAQGGKDSCQVKSPNLVSSAGPQKGLLPSTHFAFF